MVEGRNTIYGIRGEKHYYSAGDSIVQAGDPADGWYILITGRVGVFKSDFSIAEIEGRGMVFGELGCILNIPRTATLIALESTSLLLVRMTLDEIVEKHPEFTKRIMIGLAERLTKTTESWWLSATQIEV
ncbi:MAG: cyclic nucleotide-binding domain-containing protein [bacterium]